MDGAFLCIGAPNHGTFPPPRARVQRKSYKWRLVSPLAGKGVGPNNGPPLQGHIVSGETSLRLGQGHTSSRARRHPWAPLLGGPGPGFSSFCYSCSRQVVCAPLSLVPQSAQQIDRSTSSPAGHPDLQPGGSLCASPADSCKQRPAASRSSREVSSQQVSPGRVAHLHRRPAALPNLLPPRLCPIA